MAEAKKKFNNPLPLIILGFLVLIISAALAHYFISQSEKRSVAEKQIIALKEVETRWQRKTEILLSKQTDKFMKVSREHKLFTIKKEKVAFERSLTEAITKLQPKLDEKMAKRISVEIITECLRKSLDPILVTALIWRESRFNPMAHSSKGAVGLMQVRYKIWKEDPILQDNGVDAKYKLYWIDLNIKCGTEILSKYYEEANHDIAKALYRYNTGSKDIPKDIPDFTVEYVNKILLTAYRISDYIRKGNND
jgi:hypothetical protein